MIVLDASVAIKWFVRDEPLTAEAGQVLDAIRCDHLVAGTGSRGGPVRSA